MPKNRQNDDLRDAERWRALIKLARIECTDSADCEPIFTVQPPVDWTFTDFTQAIDRLRRDM